MLSGALDVYHEQYGAHTGEDSQGMPAELCERTSNWHSERRLRTGEIDNIVKRKLLAVNRVGHNGIICVSD